MCTHKITIAMITCQKAMNNTYKWHKITYVVNMCGQ